MSEIGHNSTSSELILHAVTECERIIDERSALNEEMKSILDGAEGQGLDKRTIREMIRLRALDKTEREEREALREVYKASLGLLD